MHNFGHIVCSFILLLVSASTAHAAMPAATSAANQESYGYANPDPALFYGKSRLNALTFKVNTVAAAMLITNATFELEWKRWSVQLPLYYSNIDYFSHRVKFRVGAIQPGIRYWLSPDKVLGHTGFFVGAHVGLAWYNMALGGTDRIQDHDARTPALGGGIEGGWRHTIGPSGRWKIELSVGVGVYRAHYDLINNTTGILKHTRSKAFVGLDHVGVSFGYSLDLKKGKRP